MQGRDYTKPNIPFVTCDRYSLDAEPVVQQLLCSLQPLTTEFMTRTTSSEIWYHLDDIHSICSCCWSVATYKWKIHNGKVAVISFDVQCRFQPALIVNFKVYVKVFIFPIYFLLCCISYSVRYIRLACMQSPSMEIFKDIICIVEC